MKIKPIKQNMDMIQLVAETEYEECLLERFGSMTVELFSKDYVKGTIKSMNLLFEDKNSQKNSKANKK